MITALFTATWSALCAFLLYCNYQAKLISAVVDNKDKITENKDFLNDYKLQIKVNALLEKLWPKIKHTNEKSLNDYLRRISLAIFAAIIAFLYLFPSYTEAAAIPALVTLWVTSTIGNALADKTINKKFEKYYLLPFCIFVPTLFFYIIDTSPQGQNFKNAISTLPYRYDHVITALLIGSCLATFISIKTFTKLQELLILWTTGRIFALAKKIVLLGIAPKMPEEKEMRAIAKESLVVSIQHATLFGFVIAAVIGFAEYHWGG
ncbi:hypothetical protein [Pseudomonas aeruginosa]|uniref:hypothetical protein n=1 Tax=Pseudomonas aeruginosa TaxID=287 RepID=UPI001269E1CD|nr:hypothetical protein [Pseudomonas aeruginosa]